MKIQISEYDHVFWVNLEPETTEEAAQLKFDGWEWFINYKRREWKCNQYQHWDWGRDDKDGLREPPALPPDDPNQLIIFSFDEKIDELIKESELLHKA